MTGLTVPGYTGSGPGHWQTLWEREIPGLRRVEQRDWDRPERDEWTRGLAVAVDGLGDPGLLIAHSLGCAVVAHWSLTTPSPERVLGALLVAPADVDRPGWPVDIPGFAPMPLRPLPFPSVVVASRNDEWVTVDRARELARGWGSGYVDAGAKGHLDTASGIGRWEEGLEVLDRCRRAWAAPGSGRG